MQEEKVSEDILSWSLLVADSKVVQAICNPVRWVNMRITDQIQIRFRSRFRLS